MGLFRLLFWIVLILAAVWFWRRLKRPASPTEKTPDAAPMVRCAHCGVHLPRTEALESDSQWYCSRAHLEQGPRQGER